MRLAVVSPFLDRSHGTERVLVEQLERLAFHHGCEIHLYSQHVADLAVSQPHAAHTSGSGVILWHKVPSTRGPYILQYLAWILLNQCLRRWDKFFRRLSFDLVLSPGVNCFDADVVIVHYSGHATDPSKNALSVLLGDGKGNFSLLNGSPFMTGQYPGTVAAGDLNADGLADIVVPNYEDGTLTIYLGGRNGINLAPYSPIRVGRTPHGVAIADLNHDGKGDIVVAQEEDNEVLVLLSK